MDKKCFFFIDDVIWVFRDVTRQRPASLFDNPFLKVLKTAHDLNGLKVQLNVFYRTDFFYGDDEFTLADMTADYKAEWEAASDWLKLAFHAKQEFPDYPYINASYEDVKNNFNAIQKEIFRFAGPRTFAYSVITHWLPMSKEGCQALHDCGVKVMSVSWGERYPYTGNPATLPYGHAGRLLQNRKPESALYSRGTRDVAIDSSLCGYNHLPAEKVEPILYNFGAYLDEETGMYFKDFGNSACLNLCTKETLIEDLNKALGSEFVGYATHEQYFYSDYYAYQPDYADKIYLSSQIMAENGYTYFFIDEIV